MILALFEKGVLIGLLIGVPVGAVGTLTVERTYRYGFVAGLKTGMGSSIADCIYAACGALGLTMVSEFLLQHLKEIRVAGGFLILGMGIRFIFQKEKDGTVKQEGKVQNWKYFFTAFVVGITNPATILTFLFAFSYFQIPNEIKIIQGILLVAGVFVGTMIWWIALSAGAVVWKKNDSHCMRKMHLFFGFILLLFGGIVLVRAFI